ncbi:MAG: alpha/beta fold hydrolase [Saprospirales bacterium]|nr:alpha/beta fold hydrolase [Saprospirales bacterium]
MIHGMGSNLLGWQKLIAGLRGQVRCIAFDLPNYGGSTPGNFSSTMSFFAKVAWEFADQLGLSSLALGGHSMGGQIAMIMALQRPFAVEKLILCSPAGFETFSEPERMVLNNIYAPQLLMALTEDQIRQNFYANFFRFPADAEFMIQDRLRMKESAQYEYYCRMIPKCVTGMLDEPVYPFLPSIQQPTHIFYGLQDQLIPNRLVHPMMQTKQIARRGVRNLPNAHLHLLDQCGHFPHWEQADKVLPVVRKFLS